MASRGMMTKGAPEGPILISHPQTNNGFFLLTIAFCIVNKIKTPRSY